MGNRPSGQITHRQDEKLLFLFFCSKKKEAKNAAATVISGKSHLLSKIRELASLRQPGFLNDHKFDFLTGNSFRRNVLVISYILLQYTQFKAFNNYS